MKHSKKKGEREREREREKREARVKEREREREREEEEEEEEEEEKKKPAGSFFREAHDIVQSLKHLNGKRGTTERERERKREWGNIGGVRGHNHFVRTYIL